MRSRFQTVMATAAIIGLPMWAIGQPPESKQGAGNSIVQLAGTDGWGWVYDLATPADSRLLTWSRFLGADLATADAALRAQLKLNDDEGYVVTGVTPDGAAAEGGVVLFDVVVGLADEPKPEAVYPLWVWRQGERKHLTVKLKAQRQGWIGVNLVEIDDAMRSQLSLPAGRGLLVQEVTDDSPAKKAGLQQHDVIDGWNDGTPSGTVEEFSRVIQKSADKNLAVQILRHGKTMTISVTPQIRPEQAATSDIAARWLAFQQPHVPVDLRLQRMSYLNLLSSRMAANQAATWAGMAAGNNRHSKLSRVEEQLDQLLKELQAARQTIEEIRKHDERQKEKPTDEKK